MGRWSSQELRVWLAPTPGKKRMRLGLNNVKMMLERLSNPENSFPSVHVAGTNGKGSLCAHLAAKGAANGNIIGLFTSPHLVNVEERVRIDGKPISSMKFDEALAIVREASEIEPPVDITYYEKTFLVALVSFNDAGVDRAIVETGLGGRLDATRCVNADMCAITTISEDHLEILGPTLLHVLREKAGIHREGVPLFMLEPEDQVIESEARRIIGEDLSILSFQDNSHPWDIYRSMATEMGRNLGWNSNHEDPRWPGRDGVRHRYQGSDVILSAAHNYESIIYEMERLHTPHTLLIGMTKKQDLSRVMEPIRSALDGGKIAGVVVTEPKNGRLPAEPIQHIARALGSNKEIFGQKRVRDAFQSAVKTAQAGKTPLLVLGSIYLTGHVLKMLYPAEEKMMEMLQVHSCRQPS